MSLKHHDDIDVMAGDTWTILCTLKDKSGNPLDISTASLIWTFLDQDGYICTDIVAAATITKVSPESGGQAIVTVPSGVTNRPPARYSDAMRVVIGDEVDTVFHGNILVSVDAFAQPAEPV